MFGLGWAEILLIAVVALVVVKPGEMPQTARSAGRLLRQIRQAASQAGQTLEKEVSEIKNLNPLSDLEPGPDRKPKRNRIN